MDSRELFARARSAADALERNKRALDAMRESVASPHGARFGMRVSHGSNTDLSGPIAALVDREAEMRARSNELAEAWLDAAWTAIDVVQVDFDDGAAMVLAHHYLFGETWASCAGLLGRRSRNTPQTLAWAALDWLDSVLDMSEDEAGHPVVSVVR